MESMWTIGNVECSPPKIHGVSTKSSWTPWRLMESPHGVLMETHGESSWSPHGVCGNVWGSVKYSGWHERLLQFVWNMFLWSTEVGAGHGNIVIRCLQVLRVVHNHGVAVLFCLDLSHICIGVCWCLVCRHSVE